VDKVLRLLWFWVKLLSAVTAALSVIGWSFFGAMDAANLYVLTSEGLKLRAEMALKRATTADLSTCFTENFLNNDDLLSRNAYTAYNINSYDYRINLTSMSCWPWKNTATARVTQRMSIIEGTLRAEFEEQPSFSTSPPEWENAVYILHFVRLDIGWRIDKIEFVEAVAPRWTPEWVTPPPTPTLAPPTAAP